MSMTTMNYSLFKLQTQGGKPGIFWEKEAVQKKDRKFGYKQREQRFPVRRYAGDRHEVETDLVALSPDEPPPPPKPAKNFIAKNRAKFASPKKDVTAGTVTLTQDQLDAILKSVGKVAGGDDEAVRISIDQFRDKKEILVESPRRYDNKYSDDDADSLNHRDNRRPKKKTSKKKEEEQGNSIYGLLGGDNSKSKADSRERKPRRRAVDSDDEDRPLGNRNHNRYDDDDDSGSREKVRKHRSKHEAGEAIQDLDGNRRKIEELNKELEALRRKARLAEDNDSESEARSRRRRTKSKQRHDSDYEDELDTRDGDRDHERRDRTYKKGGGGRSRKDEDEGSRERHEKRDHRRTGKDDHTSNINNNEGSSKEEVVEVESPRDKVGLPMDLSWRHMTKAEKRRLEMARQKVNDAEEKREEDRIRQLNSRYGPPDVPTKSEPQRHKTPKSEPSTRYTRVEPERDSTDISSLTNGHRPHRGRRSRSPSRERSPEISTHTSPRDSSPKGSMAVSQRHMTLAEKKRVEWERDRVESVQMQRQGAGFDPWGRPGAGAPLRTKSGNVAADYKGRQEQLHQSTIIEEEPDTYSRREPPQSRPVPQQPSYRQEPVIPHPPPSQHPSYASQPDQNAVPHAMRSSFVLGQVAPDLSRHESAKERERRQWLAELNAQIEEKKMKDMKPQYEPVQETWADKLGQPHHPLPLPEQPRDTLTAVGDPFNSHVTEGGAVLPLESNRDGAAGPGANPDDLPSHIRGQNVPLDPVTKRELEDKRRKYLDYQAAVKAQVDEKDRLKREARERKMREDMEEERKLQEERDALKHQFELEQNKIKQKEQQRTAQVNQLKAAMDEAQARALQEKYQRRMQHLEAGGHDVTKLREHLEARITPRGTDTGSVIEGSHIPGLDLNTGRTYVPVPPTGRREHNQYHPSVAAGYHEPYTEERVLTPTRLRHPSKPWSDPSSPRREFGTQTGKDNAVSASQGNVDDINQLLNPINREETDVNIEYKHERGKKVRVISAPKEALQRRGRKPTREVRDSRQSPSSRGSVSPHEHHHEIVDQKVKLEADRKKKLEVQRRKGPVKPGSRPKWGYKNADTKKPKKQSERDPFYEKRKREKEERRLKREQKLLAMVEANKAVIPEYYVPPGRRSRSRSREQSPFSDVEMSSPRAMKPGRRAKSHSPHRHGNPQQSEADYLAVHADNSSHYRHHENSRIHDHRHRERSQSPSRNESHSRDQRSDVSRTSHNRNRSPPVPALKHKNDANQNTDNQRRGGKYKDGDILNAPVVNGDFVPFTRTVEVLDPANAEEPLPLSREATRVANARRAYHESLHPEKFGNKQYVYVDKHRVVPGASDGSKDPMMNPGLVLDHPTTRQDQILVQLSTLKQSLMQRQRELETFSPTDLYRYDADIKA